MNYYHFYEYQKLCLGKLSVMAFQQRGWRRWMLLHRIVATACVATATLRWLASAGVTTAATR
jgi:hypothetical protein